MKKEINLLILLIVVGLVIFAVGTVFGIFYQLEKDSDKFDIGIFIYEKFNSLTAFDISLIKSTSCFVLDEFQMISDPKRGIEFELAIMKIRAFNPQAQIVIL